jgi:hypothetical protein
MTKLIEPAFMEQIQQAVDRGQAVIIPAPGAPAIPPRRDMPSLAVALCLHFGLNRSEGRILAELLLHDSCTKEALGIAAPAFDRLPTTVGTVGVLINSLRKKLKHRGIEIRTINKIGYGLDRTARDKVYQQLARHDASWAPAADQYELDLG